MARIWEKQKIKIIIVMISILTIILYWDTCTLPIIGDGLLHMDDKTIFSSIGDFFRPFYSLKGIKANSNSVIMYLHRPIFDEYIVPFLKAIFCENVMAIRSVSLLVFASLNICAFIVGYLVSNKKIFNGILCAIMTMFCYAYVFPLIEWGVSFSLWLGFIGYLSFIFLYQYENNGKLIYCILSLLFTFIATYIKESAIVLSVALCFHFLVFTLAKYKKINRKLIVYCLVQFCIFFSYCITRLIKLGNFFDANIVGGGVNDGYVVTPVIIIRKLYDYFLFSFSIPTDDFYNFMILHLTDINIGAATALVAAVVVLLRLDLVQFKEKPMGKLNIPVGLVMFIILMLPSTAVARNGIYYNDLAMLGILIIVASIDFNGHKAAGCLFAMSYVLVFILSIREMYLTNSHYIIKGEYQLRQIRDDLRLYDYSNKRVVQMTSFDANSEMQWYVNNVNVGTFFRYNIDLNSNVVNVDSTLTKVDFKNEIYVDYWDTQGDYYHPLTIVVNEQTSDSYNICKIKPENMSGVIYLQLNYQNKVYYRYIDAQYYSQSGNHEYLYFAIPKDGQLIYDETMIKEISYVGTN